MEKKSKEEMHGKHWIEILVDRLLEEKKPPLVITGGMTTSGPAHLGTVCEFLYPSVIRQALEERGRNAEFNFIGDILDAFDGIPFELLKYSEALTPELGKPLVFVKDPMGCHGSLGVHYLEQAEQLMKWLSLEIKVIPVNELYDAGRFDKYAITYLREEQRVKEIIAETSMKKIEELSGWSPIMPICQSCGKIATTRVTWHSDEEYEYACDRDVKYTKGCNSKGRNRIADHKYKLQWRLHWPSWQAMFSSSIEGSGLDHMTKGGSATTAPVIHREILHTDPPILFKYGFILIDGKKYSKSKGIGMGAIELAQLIPPELLKYMLIEPDLQNDKDINPTGDKLILAYDALERASRAGKAENRADEKRSLAFNAAIKRLPWKSSFIDMLLNYQILRDWDKVAEALGDKDGVAYLSPYIERWLAKGYAPDRYDFSVKKTKIDTNRETVRKFAAELKPIMTDLEVHNLVYSAAKSADITAESLFTSIYTALIGKPKGPRLGKLIVSIGIEKAKEMLDFAIS